MVAALFSSQTGLCILLLNPVTEGQAKGGLRKFLSIFFEDPGNSSEEEFYRAQPAREYSAFLINGNFMPIFQESNISFSCCKFEPSYYLYRLDSHRIISLQRERLKLRSLPFFNITSTWYFPFRVYDMPQSPCKSQPYELFVPLKIKLNV